MNKLPASRKLLRKPTKEHKTEYKKFQETRSLHLKKEDTKLLTKLYAHCFAIFYKTPDKKQLLKISKELDIVFKIKTK